MDRRPLDVRSRCLLNYSVADLLELGPERARSGQLLTAIQGNLSQGIDEGGSEYIVPLHRARLVSLDLDGDGVRETLARLMEPARTNAWSKSRDLSDAAWTKAGLNTPATDTILGPDGTTLAYKVKEDTSTGTHQVSRAMPGSPSDNVRSVYSWAVRPAERTWLWLQTVNKANTAYTSWVDLANVVAGTVNSHHTLWLDRRRDGFVRIAVSADNASGGTTPSLAYGTSTGDGVTSFTGTANAGYYATDHQVAVDGIFPTSFTPTTTASAARAADQLQVTIDVPLPNDLTVLFDVGRPAHADLGASVDLGTAPYIWAWGSSVGSNRLGVYFQKDARTIAAIIDPSAVNVSTAIPAGARIQGCAQFRNLLSGGQCRLDVGAGFGSWSSAAAAMSALANGNMGLGSLWNGSAPMGGPLISLRVVRDALLTLDEMAGYR